MKIEYILIVILAVGALSYFANTALEFRDLAEEQESSYEKSVHDLKAAVAGQ